MNPLGSLRRAPWLGGALVLVLATGLVAPVAWALGLRHWPYYVGLAASLLLLLGWGERFWQRRAAARPSRPAKRKFRVVSGGKGNGRAHDLEDDDPTGGQRWLM